MKYTDVRPQIRSGDLLAWSHGGWASWHDWQVQGVRVFTRSEYSHVAIAWVVGGRVFVIESVVGGIRIFPLSRLLPFYRLNMNATWAIETEEYALAHIGEPYSKLECIQAYFEPLKLDGHWECAKWVMAVLKMDGIDLGDKATPSDVVQAAMKRPGVTSMLVETE
jgi:hypothetical protein